MEKACFSAGASAAVCGRYRGRIASCAERLLLLLGRRLACLPSPRRLSMPHLWGHRRAHFYGFLCLQKQDREVREEETRREKKRAGDEVEKKIKNWLPDLSSLPGRGGAGGDGGLASFDTASFFPAVQIDPSFEFYYGSTIPPLTVAASLPSLFSVTAICTQNLIV